MSKKSKKSDKKSAKRQDKATKKLSAERKELQARAKKSEAAAARWKAKAKRFEAEASKNAKELRRLKRLRKDEAQAREIVVDGVEVATLEVPVASDLPDATWTVIRLRATAREAGVPGYSRMTKAGLVDALASPPAPSADLEG
jgi:hypothetical protein